MIKLLDVSVYIPEHRMELDELVSNQVITYKNVRELIKNQILSIPYESNTSLEMLFRTLDKLSIKDPEKVKIIVLCYAQMSFPNGLDILGICKGKYRFIHATGFSVMDVACSSYLMGLKVCTDWLRGPGIGEGDMGIVVTVEKSTVPSQRMGSDYFVIGDAGAAALLMKTEDGDGDHILAIHNTMDTKAVTLGLDKINRFGVGNYTHLLNLYKGLNEMLNKAGISINDVDKIIPNNVILETWYALAKMLNLPSNKFFLDGIRRIGHAVNCDLLINYQMLVEQGQISKGGLYVFISIGEGGSVGCALCRKD